MFQPAHSTFQTNFMPIRYKAEHFDFPKHLELPVFQELPATFTVRGSIFGSWEAWNGEHRLDEYRKKREEIARSLPELAFMTNCHHCGGWVPGQAHQHRVNDLDGSRLCGRRGTEYYCPRCGKEIHFSGMMS